MSIRSSPESVSGRPSPLDIWRMTASDRADGGLATNVAITSMVAGLCVEWLGPNEYLLGTTGSHALQATQNIYETGLATGLASFSLQTVVGATVAWTISRCPDAIDKFRDRLNHDKNSDELSESNTIAKKIGKKIVRPLVAGSAVNLVMEAPRSENKSFGENMRKVVGWSAIVGAGVSLLGTGGAELIVEGEKHGFESPARVIVDRVLPNPFTYLAIVGTAYGITKGVKKIRNKLSSRGEGQGESLLEA